MSKNLYQIIGVSRDATPEAIIAAAQARMEALKRAHHIGDPQAATESFALKEAFSILRDPAKRAAYDARLDAAAAASTPAADPVWRRELEQPMPPGVAGDLVIYADGEEPDEDPFKKLLALAITACLIAAWVGQRAYRAELDRLDRATADAAHAFDARGWIRTLGPAKMAVADDERAADAPKPFSLEEFEREQERRDADMRRRMERERRDYNLQQQREERDNQLRLMRGY